MAKKYLLYIHNSERFDKEKNKSGLVNDLLAEWYSEKPVKSPKVAKRITQKERQYPKIAKTVNDLEIPKKDMKFCKDGHPIPEGRSKCLGKACKYS